MRSRQDLCVPGDAWWRGAVVYQIYPRSFADTDGDGVGDLEGIRRHLDHVAGLGVDAVWLCPVYPSPLADFGYDTTDLTGVDPALGSLAGMDALVAEAHTLGLRVLLDWIPNHTSSRHPWFLESRRSRSSTRRDWYLWRDGRPDRPPNAWQSAFGGPAWTWDDGSEQWYLHLFRSSQPDLNWANPQVRDAMHATLRFWLDRGIDGFRLDVPHCIGKDPELADHPPDLTGVRQSLLNDRPETLPLLEGIRAVVDEYPGRVLIGEVNLLTTAQLRPYVADARLHLVFNFPAMRASWEAQRWRDVITEAEDTFREAEPTWFLSNHDYPRHRTRYGGSEAVARAAAVLLLTLRGAAVLYAGEELGLTDAAVPPDRRLDALGRDGARAPIPWDATEGHGWRGDPWLPWPPRADVRNVAVQGGREDSMLSLYRRLLHERRQSPALRCGALRLCPSPEGTVAWIRTHAAGDRMIAVNFTPEPVRVEPDRPRTIAVATNHRREGRPFDGHLAGHEAVVLR